MILLILQLNKMLNCCFWQKQENPGVMEYIWSRAGKKDKVFENRVKENSEKNQK